jgi:hypothetical protein
VKAPPHDKETPVDDRRFDALAKNLGTAHTRRGLTRFLGGLSLGGVLSARTVRDAAAAKLNGGAPCRSNTQCKTGKCLGNSTCSCSPDFRKCVQSRNPCKKATCGSTGRCETANRKNDVTCGDGKTCQNGVCTTPPSPCVGLGTGDPCPGGKCWREQCTPRPTCNTYTQGFDPTRRQCTTHAECCSGSCVGGGWNFCDKGASGDLCLEGFDCRSDFCVAYHCL